MKVDPITITPTPSVGGGGGLLPVVGFDTGLATG